MPTPPHATTYGTAALLPGEVSTPYYVREGVFIIEVLSAPEWRELDARMSLNGCKNG